MSEMQNPSLSYREQMNCESIWEETYLRGSRSPVSRTIDLVRIIATPLMILGAAKIAADNIDTAQGLVGLGKYVASMGAGAVVGLTTSYLLSSMRMNYLVRQSHDAVEAETGFIFNPETRSYERPSPQAKTS